MKKSLLLPALLFAAGLMGGLLLGSRRPMVQTNPALGSGPAPAAATEGATPPDPRPLEPRRATPPRGDAVAAAPAPVSAPAREAKRETGPERIPGHRALSPAEVETELRNLSRRNFPWHRQYRELFDWVRDIAPAEAPRYLAVAEKLGDTDTSSTWFGSLLLTRWAEQAPGDAMEWALAARPSHRRDAWLTAALDAWTRADPKAAEAWVRQNAAWKPQQAWTTFLSALAATDAERAVSTLGSLPADVITSRRTLDYSLVRTWAASDPTAAIAWAENAGSFSQRRHLIATAVATWAAAEPAAAAAYASAVTHPEERRSLLATVAQTWASRDVEAAVAWVRSLPEDAVRNQCIQSVITTVVRADPDRAMAMLEWISNDAIRQQTLSSLLPQVGAERALQIIRALPSGRKRAALVERNLWSFSNENPALMIQLVEELAPELTPSTLSSAAGLVAEYDIPKALEFCRLIKSATYQQSALQSVVGRWASERPAEALAYAESLPEGLARTNCINQSVQAWANADPIAALEWANRFRDWPYPNPLSTAITAWAARDPREAADYVAKLDPGTPFQRQVAVGVLGQWVWRDPPAAAAWAQGFPEGESRDGAIATVVSSWCSSDEEAATAFVQKMPADKGRDKAVEAMVNQMSHQSPERAIALAALIGDETVRGQRLTTLARNWMRNDPEAAKAWVAQSSLSEEQKRTVLGAGR